MEPSPAVTTAPAGKAEPTAAQASPGAGRITLASAPAGEFSGGYLQTARVDLPPLQNQSNANAGSSAPVRTADGYGAGNHGPVADGVYTGPRVSTPYDRRDEPGEYDSDRDAHPERDYKPREPYRRYDRPQVYDRVPAGEPDNDDRRRWRDRGPEDRSIPHDNHAPHAPRPYEPEPYAPGEGRSFYRNPAREELPSGRDERAIGDQTSIKRPGASVASERGAGKVVTVAPGETVYDLARRYGVPPRDILNSNGLYGQRLKPGQDVLIPSRSGESFASVTPGAAKPADRACAEPRCHIVAKGETLSTLAKRYNMAEDKIASANALPDGTVAIGQSIAIPARDDKAKTPQAAATSRVAEAEATGEPQGKPDTASVSPVVVSGKQAGDQSCDAALSNPLPRTGKTFRKPVEGLIISQFGPQRDGKVNDGVAISVPKGTPVKAAENGVVAYVGEELEGFGKLVLIRHADDYVTAYAHADEILVKRCEVVKRGQVIAKAGATGEVSQPQVHFEIRKSQKAIDPVPLLSS